MSSEEKPLTAVQEAEPYMMIHCCSLFEADLRLHISREFQCSACAICINLVRRGRDDELAPFKLRIITVYQSPAKVSPGHARVAKRQKGRNEFWQKVGMLMQL